MHRLLIKTLLAVFFIILPLNYLIAQEKLNLMPMPKMVEMSSGEFILNKNFRISFGEFKSKNLSEYSTRFLKHLANKTGLFFPNIYLDEKGFAGNTALIINVKRSANLKLGEDESYILEIKDTKILLSADTEFGAYRGLETLLQLLTINNREYVFPNLKITDEPRFPWRGLMIDVARHFMPVDVIKRNIDGMAAMKLNVLHMHLCDDQGFRVECKTFPKLHENASDGQYFTQVQIKDIIDYAARRGIRIIPEFDMPGHGTSFITAYPELGSKDSTYTLERGWGVFDPTLNPIKQNTYDFISKFIAEMADLFPDEYFHIGGDENNGVHWKENSDIKEFKSKMGFESTLELQNYFNHKIVEMVENNGKKMIGWDEILVPELHKNVVIQSWRGKEALISAAQNGYQVMLSNGYYIDLIQPTDYHYLNDPITEDMNLTKEQEKMVLGGEATMWAEFITPETIDSRIWPRMAAIAERFWSPSNVKDVADMYRRLEFIEYHLEEYNLTHLKNRDMMLRRLSSNQDIEPLKILLTAVEPLKIYTRHHGRDYTSYSPLSRLVDAAYPDPKETRDFNNTCIEYLGQKKSDVLYSKLETQLTIWKENHKKLIPIINQSPILREIESLSYDLNRVAEIGITALGLIKNDKQSSGNWKKESTGILNDCKVPRGENELMVIESIQKLVDAVK